MSKLLTGLLAGIAIGILIAPDKGSETRRKIADRAQDLRERFNDFIDEFSENFEPLREEASELLNEGREPILPQRGPLHN